MYIREEIVDGSGEMSNFSYDLELISNILLRLVILLPPFRNKY